MPVSLPLPTQKIFEILDIPELFLRERIECSCFQKLLSKNYQNNEKLDIDLTFSLIHVSTRLFILSNYLYIASLHEPIFRKPEGRQSLKYGFFAIIYSMWDYNFYNENIGIDGGIERLKLYFQDNIYENLPDDEKKFLRIWVTEKLDLNRIITILNLLRRPFISIPSNLSESDSVTIKILRDAIIYAPIYLAPYFYYNESENINYFHITVGLFIHYGIKTVDGVINCIDQFYRSKKPYIEFTKKIIEIYNHNKSTNHVLNEVAIQSVTRSIDTLVSNENTDFIVVANPHTFNEESNIF